MRREYEEIVSEVQSEDGLDSLSLAKEQPMWNSEVCLCFPVFKAEYMHINTSVSTDLPDDRKSLIQLRQQLAMELVWIKQAIASRQKVFLTFVMTLIILSIITSIYN